MSIVREVIRGCWWGWVVSSYSVPEGIAGGLGAAQSSLSNYGLQAAVGVGIAAD